MCGRLSSGRPEAARRIFEACAGLWSRAFAGGTSGELSSDVLARIGRELVTFGQSLWVVQGKTILSPVSSVDIEGGFDPASWVYRCSMPGPTRSETRRIPASNVLHLRINEGPTQPWRGRSPWALIPDTAHLLQGLERQLRDEANGPSGFLLPVPKPSVDLASDVAGLAGRVVLGESVSVDNHGLGGRGSPTGEWRLTRFEPDRTRRHGQAADPARGERCGRGGYHSGLAQCRLCRGGWKGSVAHVRSWLGCSGCGQSGARDCGQARGDRSDRVRRAEGRRYSGPGQKLRCLAQGRNVRQGRANDMRILVTVCVEVGRRSPLQSDAVGRK